MADPEAELAAELAAAAEAFSAMGAATGCGTRALAQALPALRCLRELNLSANAIGDDGAALLLHALLSGGPGGTAGPPPPPLSRLDLQWCSLTAAVAAPLRRLLTAVTAAAQRSQGGGRAALRLDVRHNALGMDAEVELMGWRQGS